MVTLGALRLNAAEEILVIPALWCQDRVARIKLQIEAEKCEAEDAARHAAKKIRRALKRYLVALCDTDEAKKLLATMTRAAWTAVRAENARIEAVDAARLAGEELVAIDKELHDAKVFSLIQLMTVVDHRPSDNVSRKLKRANMAQLDAMIHQVITTGSVANLLDGLSRQPNPCQTPFESSQLWASFCASCPNPMIGWPRLRKPHCPSIGLTA